MSEELRTVTIPFPRPLKIGDNVYAAVTMREPTVEDEIAVAAASATGTDQEKEARLVARLCDLPVEGVQKMKSGQYRELQRPLLVLLSTPWTESTGTSLSSRDSQGGDGKKSAE